MTDLRFKSFVALSAGALFLAAGPTTNAEELSQENQTPVNAVSKGLFQLAQSQAGGADQKEAARALLNTSIDYMLPAFGEDLPEYLKRFEFEVELQENLKPEWSLLTVQPLYQTDSKEHTVFTQLSQRRYNQLGLDRDVTNVGVGYRKLFADNTILAGVNTFFDYEWKRHHKRAGVGFEAKWSGLDFTANTYYGIGGKTGQGLSGDTEEQVLDGRDFELTAQLPYLPWARVHAKRYYWESVSNSEDVKGWAASLEADVQQNFRVEAGYKDDNFMASREHFLQMTFHVPFGAPRPTMTSSQFISDQAWTMQDMREHTLDKVRRENKIIVEQTSSGVVITRGS